jgi:hypothetical protein
MYHDSKRHTLWFRIVFDSSPGDATHMFSLYKGLGPGEAPVAGVGDGAYFDGLNNLHVRKGSVWFNLVGGSADGDPPPEGLDRPRFIALARAVLGKL